MALLYRESGCWNKLFSVFLAKTEFGGFSSRADNHNIRHFSPEGKKTQKIPVYCIFLYKETSEAVEAVLDLLYFILMDSFN